MTQADLERCFDELRKLVKYHVFIGQFLVLDPQTENLDSRIITNFNTDNWIRVLGMVQRGHEILPDSAYETALSGGIFHDTIDNIVGDQFQCVLVLYTPLGMEDEVYIFAKGPATLVQGLNQSIGIIVSATAMRNFSGS